MHTDTMSSSTPEKSLAKQSRRRTDNDKDEEGSNNTTKRATVSKGDPARPFVPAHRLPTTGKLALVTPSNEPEGMVLEVFRHYCDLQREV